MPREYAADMQQIQIESTKSQLGTVMERFHWDTCTTAALVGNKTIKLVHLIQE